MANCFLGAFPVGQDTTVSDVEEHEERSHKPPVDLRAVCLVRAIANDEVGWRVVEVWLCVVGGGGSSRETRWVSGAKLLYA